MKLGASIHPDEDAPYNASGGPPCFQISYRCLALYTTKGGNLTPAADPHPGFENLLHSKF